MEALPVTSGESATESRIRKRWASLAKLRTASKLRRRFIPAIIALWDNEMGSTEKKRTDERTVGSRYAQFGTRVLDEMGSGKLRDEFGAQKLGEMMCNLRSANGNNAAIGDPCTVADHKSVHFDAHSVTLSTHTIHVPPWHAAQALTRLYSTVLHLHKSPSS